MINSMDEFIKEHGRAVIVNYDIAEKFGYGKTYRVSKEIVEKFRKDYKGNYIKYPFIQPYLKLNDFSSYELFIIHNNKIYQLEKGNDKSYKIFKELDNIAFDISLDDVFYRVAKDPVIVKEDLFTVVE